MIMSLLFVHEGKNSYSNCLTFDCSNVKVKMITIVTVSIANDCVL